MSRRIRQNAFVSSFEVIVVGSANMDLVSRVPRFPDPGETLTGREFRTFPGGKGANQAVAVGRLGGKTAFVGKVGNDAFGPELRASLAEAGVDTRYLLVDEGASGVATILVDDAAENQIVVIPGANGTLTPGEVEEAIGTAAASVALFQLETPIKTVWAGLAAARRAGMRTILNPAPAQTLDPEMLALVDCLTPNQTEAARLTHVEDHDPAMLAEALLDLGVGAVAITLGEAGSYWADSETREHVPSIRVQAVDTTAAGDAFNGALALCMARGRPPLKALEWANRAGAMAATRPGAQSSLPTWEELSKTFS